MRQFLRLAVRPAALASELWRSARPKQGALRWLASLWLVVCVGLNWSLLTLIFFGAMNLVAMVLFPEFLMYSLVTFPIGGVFFGLYALLMMECQYRSETRRMQ